MTTTMKNKVWMMLVVSSLLITSCHPEFVPGIVGRGEIVTQTLDVDDFTGFVSTIAADVYISQGDEFEVIMEAQQNIIDDLDTDWISNGIWTIKYRHWIKFSKPVKLFITMPDLTKACIAGSGSVSGETSFTNLGNLDLVITGSGSVDLDVDCADLDITISGSGDMQLEGYAENLDCLITGSGKIRGADLNLNRAEIRITGSGDAWLNVEEYLDVVISGSGNVFYYGDPELSSRISGSGEVKRGI